MANCAREKSHLEHKVDRMKDSKNPDTIFAFLETINPDAEAMSRTVSVASRS